MYSQSQWDGGALIGIMGFNPLNDVHRTPCVLRVSTRKDIHLWGQRSTETAVTGQGAQQQEEAQHTGRGQVEVTQVGR